jgi:hypothetical protein
MTTTTDNMESLEPSGSSVTYGSETIEVTPLRIGALPKIVRTARPVIESLMTQDIEGMDEAGMVRILLDTLEHHGEALYAGVGLCVGKPATFIENGDAEEFIRLALKVWEVNRDFFVLKVAPLLGGLKANLAA